MNAIATALAIVSLVLGASSLFQHTSKATVALVPMKYVGTALSAHLALAGALGAGLGLVSHSPVAVVAGMAGAALSVHYVMRASAPHDGFKRAFGSDWKLRIPAESERRMLQRRWTWQVPGVPEPRWTRDVAFWTIPGTERCLLADIWEPPPGVTPSGTAIVYLHGGAWYLLDKDVLTRSFFRQLVARGHVVMDVSYRSCPEVDVRGMVADAKRAVAWVKSNAVNYGVDPEKVVLMGASSGGHVVLLAAYAPDHPQFTPEELRGADTTVMAAVSYYGVPDMRAYGEHTTARLANPPEQPHMTRGGRQPSSFEQSIHKLMFGRTLMAEQLPPSPLHRQMMRELLGGMPDEVPEMYNLASPIHHVSSDSPPTLIFQGAHDSIVPVASARRLRDTLAEAGVPVVYVEFPATEHAFDILYPPLVGPAAQAALYDLERFLVLVGTTPGRQ